MKEVPRHPETLPARREFVRWLAASPLVAPLLAKELLSPETLFAFDDPTMATNVMAFEALAKRHLDPDIYSFIAGGSDDEKTLAANRAAFDQVQIRARRLVDVSAVDTSVEVLGESMSTPILIAPVGTQGAMHPEGELGTARAAANRDHTLIASTVSTHSIGEIADAYGRPPWFQLYPTPDLSMTEALLDQAEAAGCRVCALTVDTPVLGNREAQRTFIAKLLGSGQLRLGNFDELGMPAGVDDPALTWDFVDWLRSKTAMKLLIKGVVTHEDATLCVDKGVDGLIVSNHGGRQLESLRSTFEALPEIAEAVDGRIAVLMDGGIVRGTHIFKALASGADAICVGRAWLWGLATFGQPGVEHALDILRAELVRDMQLAGTPNLAAITGDFLG